MFEWHFTIRGPADSEFEGGIYHGRIVLPPEYPMKPPSIILLTVSVKILFMYLEELTFSIFEMLFIGGHLQFFLKAFNTVTHWYFQILQQ